MESKDLCEDDYSIKVSAAIVSTQCTKKDDHSLEANNWQQQTIWLALNKIIFVYAIIGTYIGSLCKLYRLPIL